jgi:hypothetical protein
MSIRDLGNRANRRWHFQLEPTLPKEGHHKPIVRSYSYSARFYAIAGGNKDFRNYLKNRKSQRQMVVAKLFAAMHKTQVTKNSFIGVTVSVTGGGYNILKHNKGGRHDRLFNH